MLRLPQWMRIAMFLTAPMNLFGAVMFLPSSQALRKLGGLPENAHPLYLMVIGVFILIFGLAYLWSAVTAKADQLFVAVAAAGKLSFFGLLVWFWATGQLPLMSVLAGVGDLVFGSLFLVWLFGLRSTVNAK